MKVLYITLFIFCLGFVQAQEWEMVGDVPFHKHHSNGFSYEGKAYVFQGTNNEVASNLVWSYDPITNEWTELDPFPGEARGIAIGDDWNNKYYLGFGRGQNGYLNDLWEYDPATDTYEQLPSCPCQGRSHPAFVAHNDKIFMGSGSTGNGDLKDWWVYDMLTQTWEQKEDIPGSNRHHPFQFHIDDIIYIGGGHVSNWLSYNPATEEWGDISNLPQGRVAGSQFSYNGRGYVLAGDDTWHNHVPTEETFLEYNAETDTWKQLPELPNGSRWAPSSFIIDNELYFFGGINFTIQNDRQMWKIDLSLINGNPTSVEEKIIETAIDLFPNPAQDEIQITTNLSDSDTKTISIYDIQGRLALQVQQDLSSSPSIQIESLDSGFYILKIQDNERLMQASFMKQ